MTGGFIACIIVAPILFVLCLGVAASAFWYQRDCDDIDRPFVIGIGVLASLGLIATCLGFGIGIYPYNMAYHSYRTVGGQVASVKAVTLDSDWVVKFKGNPNLYDCQETRCADAQPGSHLSLRCVEAFAYSATSSWNCKFGRLDG